MSSKQQYTKYDVVIYRRHGRMKLWYYCPIKRQRVTAYYKSVQFASSLVHIHRAIIQAKLRVHPIDPLKAEIFLANLRYFEEIKRQGKATTIKPVAVCIEPIVRIKS